MNPNFKSVGLFSINDNLQNSDKSSQSLGPFTVKDNLANNVPRPQLDEPSNSYVRFSSSSGIGPFTRADNSKAANTKLIDYIKEINAKESMKDYYNTRKLRSYDQNYDHTQFQRRMLYYPGKYVIRNFIYSNIKIVYNISHFYLVNFLALAVAR